MCVYSGFAAEHIASYGGIVMMNQQAKDWILTLHKDDYDSHKANGSIQQCLQARDGTLWRRMYSKPKNVEPYAKGDEENPSVTICK